jgi:hypothetical protein
VGEQQLYKLRRHPRSTSPANRRFVNRFLRLLMLSTFQPHLLATATSDFGWLERCLLPCAVSQAADHANRHEHGFAIGIDVDPILPTSKCLQSKAVLFLTSQSVNWRPKRQRKNEPSQSVISHSKNFADIYKEDFSSPSSDAWIQQNTTS